jgi:hypothetical protein
MKQVSWVLLVCAVLLVGMVGMRAQPGPPRTYTLEWTHDGVGTDGYTVRVDGLVDMAAVPTCAGTPRVCSRPLSMTTNVPHVVTVEAHNIFGSATSDPFDASPPRSRPAGVVIK